MKFFNLQSHGEPAAVYPEFDLEVSGEDRVQHTAGQRGTVGSQPTADPVCGSVLGDALY